MKYYSTNRKAEEADFKTALLNGLPPDNGLYMPDTIPCLPNAFFEQIHGLSLADIGFEVVKHFVDENIQPDDLKEIISSTLSFDIPLVEVSPNIYAIELFHGPTMAFKDVGARFLSRCLNHLYQDEAEKPTVLVATSGDTGGAVGHSFLGLDINVIILFPKNQVSELQERQLTTLGQNVLACEVDGTFDDCQRMVKEAFLDEELSEQFQLTSANSINIARLIPQSIYYFWLYAQLGKTSKNLVVSVPSGNYGNLTAGLIAKRMGLPIKKFIASSNINDIVPHYLETAEFNPKVSLRTISNAMDVGNPSNFYRLTELYENDWEEMNKDICGFFATDEQTKVAIQEVEQTYNYLMDPHGAIGYLGLKKHLDPSTEVGVFLETAHPAKFLDVVEPVINRSIKIPPQLNDLMSRESNSTPIDANISSLKAIIRSLD